MSLLYADDGVLASGLHLESGGDIFFTLWDDEATVERLRAVGQAQQAWLSGLSERAYVISLVEISSARMMSQEARALAGEIRDRTGDGVAGMCIVLLAQGFRGAMIRSIIGTVELLGHGIHRNVVVNSVEGACQEAARALRVPIAPPFTEELAAEIERLREARRRGLTMP